MNSPFIYIFIGVGLGTSWYSSLTAYSTSLHVPEKSPFCALCPETNKENDSFVRADEGEEGLQIYGREAAKGFFDAQGNEIEMKKHQVWFDIGEEVYFTTSIDSPNMALNVTLSRDDTASALAVSI